MSIWTVTNQLWKAENAANFTSNFGSHSNTYFCCCSTSHSQSEFRFGGFIMAILITVHDFLNFFNNKELNQYANIWINIWVTQED